MRNEFDTKLVLMEARFQDQLARVQDQFQAHTTAHPVPEHSEPGDAAAEPSSPLPEGRSRQQGEHHFRKLSSSARDAATSHHEWTGPILHQFADVHSCLKGDGAFTMILPGEQEYHKLEIFDRLNVHRATLPPPFTVHYAGSCSGAPTLHTELVRQLSSNQPDVRTTAHPKREK
eukprot:7382629-Prymnesium_polylepis.2